MKPTEISFVSSRKRGMTPDLVLVKEYLREQIENVSFRYFNKSELNGNYMVKMGVRAAKKDFCRNLTNALGVDSSISEDLEIPSGKGSRILLAIPYNDQYTDYLKSSEEVAKTRYRSYSHVFTFSPFTRQLFSEKYQMDGAEVIDGLCSPLAWDINQEQKQNAVRDEIAKYFPEVRNRKVLVILSSGKIKEEGSYLGNGEALKAFLRQLGEEWFVLTNCPELIEGASSLGEKHRVAFASMTNLFPNNRLLYIADALVTNNGMMSCCFASRRKPVYCMKYVENSFEKYMKQEYPALYFETLEGLCQVLSGGESSGKETSDFLGKMSYAPEKNPCEAILDLIR